MARAGRNDKHVILVLCICTASPDSKKLQVLARNRAIGDIVQPIGLNVVHIALLVLLRSLEDEIAGVSKGRFA